MTISNINRRTLLLGTAALPMAPVGTQAAEPDPAVLAYREWLDSLAALKAADHSDDDASEGLACKVCLPAI